MAMIFRVLPLIPREVVETAGVMRVLSQERFENDEMDFQMSWLAILILQNAIFKHALV